MSQENGLTISDKMSDLDAVQRALSQGVRTALRRHALEGRSVPIWRNERVEWVMPLLDGTVPADAPALPLPDFVELRGTDNE